MKVPDVPYQVDKWRRAHPGEEIPEGHVFTQPWPAGPSAKRRDQMIYYQYKADRARRTCAGSMSRSPRPRRPWLAWPVKRNRFIALDGAVKDEAPDQPNRPPPQRACSCHRGELPPGHRGRAVVRPQTRSTADAS
jgi:hypothetical protein